MHTRFQCSLRAARMFLYGSVLTAGIANAVPITYIFSGTASGTLNGVSFTDAAFLAQTSGDTNNVVDSSSLATNPTSTFTISIGGFAVVHSTGPGQVFSNKSVGVWGFTGTDADWLDVANANAATYNLETFIAPSTGTQHFAGTVPTDGGALVLTTVPLTFQAVPTPEVSPVPALQPYALGVLAMLLGAGALLMLRSRRTPSAR